MMAKNNKNKPELDFNMSIKMLALIIFTQYDSTMTKDFIQTAAFWYWDCAIVHLNCHYLPQVGYKSHYTVVQYIVGHA